MPRNKNQPPEQAEAKTLIKQAALKLFSEKGFYFTSTRDITHAAGVSKGTLYWYWKSKEEIAFSLVSDMLDDFVQLLERARDEEGPVLERFERLIKAVAEVFYLNTDHLRLLWKFRADRKYIFSPNYTKQVTSYYVRMRQALERLLEQGRQSGELRPVDSRQMAFILLAVAEGIEVEWLENEAEFSLRQALPEIMNIVLSSLKTGGQDRPDLSELPPGFDGGQVRRRSYRP
ncbi:MAG: TetR/AcrR family transcriptional regulator [Thermodesulfobacteriota bacterium]